MHIILEEVLKCDCLNHFVIAGTKHSTLKKQEICWGHGFRYDWLTPRQEIMAEKRGRGKGAQSMAARKQRQKRRQGQKYSLPDHVPSVPPATRAHSLLAHSPGKTPADKLHQQMSIVPL